MEVLRMLRKATPFDINSITLIYNDAVINTTATFDTHPKSDSNRLDWLKNRDENFPVIVAEENNEIVGYASLSQWSDKKAYNITAEISIYVHPEHRGKGFGKKLIHEILILAEKTNLHSIIARISEGNEHSIYLHHKEGFQMVGVLKEVGRKFGKLLDVSIMQKILK